MKKMFIAVLLAALALTVTGCAYTKYTLQIDDYIPENPHNVKFYPIVREVEDSDMWRQKLCRKYPGYFSADMKNAVPIVFEWKIDERLMLTDLDSAIITGLTFGLVPAKSKGYFYASITARYPECSAIYGSIDGAGYWYKIKADSLQMPLFFLSIITYPVAAAFMADNYSDFETSAYALELINPSRGYSLCDKNLKLFPLACLQMMNRPMTFEELQAGSKYFPHLKKYLAELTPQQKQELLFQQRERENKRMMFESRLREQYNAQLRRMEQQSRQIQEISNALQQTHNAISLGVTMSSSSRGYSGTNNRSYYNRNTGAGARTGNGNSQSRSKVKVKTSVTINCYKHGTVKPTALGKCPDCYADSFRIRFAD